MMNQIVIRSFALVFLALFSLSYHAKSRINILIVQIIALLFLVAHYYFLKAWSGMAMILIQSVILCIFVGKDQSKTLNNKIVLYTSLLIFFLFILYTWQGYFSVFAFLGVSLAVIGKWQNRPRLIRLISAPSGIFWIIYDLFVSSYGGVIMESIILGSIILSLLNEKKQRTKE